MREQMKALDDLEMDDLWERARTRTPSPEEPEPSGHKWRARSLTYALSALVLAFIVFLVMTLLPLGDEHKAPTENTPQPPVPLKARVTDTIDIGSTPSSIAAGAGGVWVSAPMIHSPMGTDSVIHIDPSTNEVAAQIPVPGVFGSVSDIAADGAAVWVTTADRQAVDKLVLNTFQINPAANSLGTPIPDVGGQLAVSGNTVWALRAGTDSTPTALVKLDASTGSTLATTNLGGTGTDIVLGDGFVWVPLLTSGADVRQVVQVDEATGTLVRTLSIPNASGTFDTPVVAGGALWVPVCCVDNQVSLYRVDPDTGHTVGTPAPVADGLPFGSAYGNILLMSERGTLSALDQVSLSLDNLAKSEWPSAHTTMVYDASTGAVWVANYRNSVTRIDVQPAPDSAGTPTPSESSDPWASLTSGLNEFPPPPSARYGSAQVWTGSELVVWGGAQNDGAVRFDDGFSLDPVHRRWTMMPASPLTARYFPAAVWTGNEVLIWGGWEREGAYLSDGAAFDPTSQTWRSLPQAPITYGRSLAVWTGTEMLIWNPDDGTGAAYDPASNTWRGIEDSPFSLERAYTAVWTGAEMIVLGMSSDGSHEEIRARGLSYDVATDTWAELPRPDLSEDAVTIVWTGTEVIGADNIHQVQSYRPGAVGWTDLPAIPLKDGEGWPNAVAYASGDVFVDTVSGQIVLNIATDTWGHVLPPLRPADGYLDPVSAGGAIILMQGGPTTPAPDVMYVWRPHPTSATG